MRWQPLAWPLPALLGWALAWALFAGLRGSGVWPLPAWALAALLPVLLWRLPGMSPHRWRRWMLVAGFPLSSLMLVLAAGGAAGLPAWPAWGWLLPALVLAGLYPQRAWRDAPFYPTPPGALAGLAEVVHLPEQAAVLDAGCGAGHGLAALRQALPLARLHGVEWSRPLAAWARLRQRHAHVQQGDLWADHWGGYALVYLFQRPETMPRAWAKARAEMRPGAWLASLEFAVPGVAPTARLPGAAGRPVWLYRLSGDRPAQPARGAADNGRNHRPGRTRHG